MRASVSSTGSTWPVEAIQLDVTDDASVRAAAARCGNVTLLINNAGIGSLNNGILDPDLVDSCRSIFDTNFYGMIRASQAFAPVITANGGATIANVLSDASWFSRPFLAAYSTWPRSTRVPLPPRR